MFKVGVKSTNSIGILQYGAADKETWSGKSSKSIFVWEVKSVHHYESSTNSLPPKIEYKTARDLGI